MSRKKKFLAVLGSLFLTTSAFSENFTESALYLRSFFEKHPNIHLKGPLSIRQGAFETGDFDIYLSKNGYIKATYTPPKGKTDFRFIHGPKGSFQKYPHEKDLIKVDFQQQSYFFIFQKLYSYIQNSGSLFSPLLNLMFSWEKSFEENTHTVAMQRKDSLNYLESLTMKFTEFDKIFEFNMKFNNSLEYRFFPEVCEPFEYQDKLFKP